MIKEKEKDNGGTEVWEVKVGRQVFWVSTKRGNREEIKNLFSQLEELEIEEPKTKRVELDHGGYGAYTRFSIKQHRYAGGGYSGCGGYVEVLEIKNPPDGRCGIVIYDFHSQGHHRQHIFSEFISLKAAIKAFDKSIDSGTFPGSQGFIRQVQTGPFEPWFYAIGNQEIVNDMVFPSYVCQESAVYRPGRKFVIEDDYSKFTVKTCVGSYYVLKESTYSTKKEKYLVVEFSDGTEKIIDWDIRQERIKPLDEIDPCLAAELEKKVGRFDELLGEKQSFTLHLFGHRVFQCKLTDGRFKCRLRKKK